MKEINQRGERERNPTKVRKRLKHQRGKKKWFLSVRGEHFLFLPVTLPTGRAAHGLWTDHHQQRAHSHFPQGRESRPSAGTRKLRVLESSSGSGLRADFQGLLRRAGDTVALGLQRLGEESSPRLRKMFPKELLISQVLHFEGASQTLTKPFVFNTQGDRKISHECKRGLKHPALHICRTAI